MKQTTKLLQLLKSPKLLVMGGAYDALSARLTQEAGFEAIQVSGMGLAAASGYPDVSVLSMREVVSRTEDIIRAVSIPVMGDADTGYGNAVNTWYTVRDFEMAGAAGINLEDQVLPKRCGRLEGKEVVSIGEMIGKIQAAVDARNDSDFVINARTDALSLNGLEDVVARGNAWLKAGATMFFVEGVRNRDEIKYLAANIDGLLAINLIEDDVGKGLQDITFQEIESMGVARVSVPLSPLLGAVHGMRKALAKINEWNGARFDPEVHVPFSDIHELAGMRHAVSIGERFNREV